MFKNYIHDSFSNNMKLQLLMLPRNLSWGKTGVRRIMGLGTVEQKSSPAETKALSSYKILFSTKKLFHEQYGSFPLFSISPYCYPFNPAPDALLFPITPSCYHNNSNPSPESFTYSCPHSVTISILP